MSRGESNFLRVGILEKKWAKEYMDARLKLMHEFQIKFIRKLRNGWASSELLLYLCLRQVGESMGI